MEKYSRYIDKDGRLFIIIRRLMSVDKDEAGTWIEKRTTITLLNVEEQKEQEVKVEDFERWLTKGLLKPIHKK